MKNFITNILPPVFLRLYRESFGGRIFRGPYTNWRDARAVSTGYNSDAIIRKVRQAACEVRDGRAVFERDSVLFERIQYSWPVLAAILWAASRNGNRLSLVDFGGALCSSYYQNRAFLCHLESFRWSIVEQEKFVTIGKAEFENQHIRFYSDLDECHKKEAPQVLLLSSVLQYMEDPYGILGKAFSLKFETIIVDRILLFDEGPEEIAIQVVPPNIYRASYPIWFLDRKKFLNFVSDGYKVVAEFDSLAGTIRFGSRLATDRGFILSKKKE